MKKKIIGIIILVLGIVGLGLNLVFLDSDFLDWYTVATPLVLIGIGAMLASKKDEKKKTEAVESQRPSNNNATEKPKYITNDAYNQKKVSKTKEKNNNSQAKTNHKAYDYNVLQEKISGINPVEGERNNEICQRFIMNGLVEYKNNKFDEETLNELSFDEFAHIYSTIGWFVNAFNLSEQDITNAVKYKKFLRKRLLARLSTFPIYAVYSSDYDFPYVIYDKCIRIFTDKECAELLIEKTGNSKLKTFEITPDSFELAFSEYYCAGYEYLTLNSSSKIAIKDIIDISSIERYGNICIESCRKILKYTILHDSCLISTIDKHNLSESDVKEMKNSFDVACESLLNDTLLLPVENEDATNISFFVPCVSLRNGNKYIALFTDQWAINRYFKKFTSSVAFPDLLIDQYKQIKNDDNISGIIINPGRESFVIDKAIIDNILLG